jgi:hypothetical protein
MRAGFSIKPSMTKGFSIFALFLFAVSLVGRAVTLESSCSPYQKWTHGPSTDPGYFPIAVWLQDPANAEKFKQAGINTYVGLWEGPTEQQIVALKQAGMKVICEQNEVALRHLDDPTIIAWMHGDEPDNAQPLPGDKGYGPPIKPEKIIGEYAQIIKADPTRPVMLNLGQGVAWNDYYGRGARTGHAEDYPEYLKGADIASFDIYPVVHESPVVAGKLWYVAQGVDRLTGWARGEKAVWNCLECTHIGAADRKATPHQVRCEAWMSLIHGSQGLIYFVHQFAPKFREAALLDDPEMLAAVAALNKQITSLAPVLNSPTISGVGAIVVGATDAQAPVDIMVKDYQGSTYIFAVGMRDATTKASFMHCEGGLKRAFTVTVIDENRTIDAKDGAFTDTFAPWDVHLYKIETTP